MNPVKTTALVVGIALSGALCAAETAKPQAPAANTNAAPVAAEIDEAQAGFLYTPNKGPKILVWDARTNSNERVLRRFLGLNDPAKRGGPGLAVTTERTPLAPKDCAFTAACAKLGPKVSMVIAVVNGGVDKPRMSVFPEDRVGIVNADRLPALLNEKLVIREIWRAIGFTGGTGFAPYRGCVMQPVYNENEIAGLMGDVLQLMTLQPFRKFEDRFGMKRTQYVTYEIACYQGFAPEPTNAVQKIIWDEIKAELSKEPTKPIEIKK